ncbi:hypothetical protein [Epibacterium ulvae]|uniref:hypothetical protein n=1 Tax=Epibacterium ulvae TaxID=1156985 RepID=UPI00249278C1|nr:hypothetical protein [Epibacterium ulvae]
MTLQWETLDAQTCYKAPAPIFGSIRVERYSGDEPWQVNWSVQGYCAALIEYQFPTATEAMLAADKNIHAALNT